MAATIVLAGATGDLGGRIAAALLERGARVRALVRAASAPRKIAPMRARGAAITEVDFDSFSELTAACSGASCVVSAVSGLREVILGAQTVLLQAAVEAGVPRFIPSDFALDFTKVPEATEGAQIDGQLEGYPPGGWDAPGDAVRADARGSAGSGRHQRGRGSDVELVPGVEPHRAPRHHGSALALPPRRRHPPRQKGRGLTARFARCSKAWTPTSWVSPPAVKFTAVRESAPVTGNP